MYSKPNDYSRENQQKRAEELKQLEDMSVDELKAELEKRTKEALVTEIKTINQTVVMLVQQHARDIIAGALGFDSRFGRWEVDHCNSRQTAIANALGQAALSQIQLALPDFIAEMKVDISKQDFMTGAGRRDYTDQLRRRLAEHMQKWVEDEALRQSKELIEQLKPPEKKK